MKTDGSLLLERHLQHRMGSLYTGTFTKFYIVISDFKLVSALRNLV